MYGRLVDTVAKLALCCFERSSSTVLHAVFCVCSF